MTSIPGNDDGLEAGRRRDFRGEFRQIVHTDPQLARLAVRSYPHLPLRSTFVISLVTLLLAMLTQNTVLAAVLGILLLAGHATVVHLLAKQDEHGSGILLMLLRGGCGLAIVLIVGTTLATVPTSVRAVPTGTSSGVGQSSVEGVGGASAGTTAGASEGSSAGQQAGQPAGQQAGRGQGGSAATP